MDKDARIRELEDEVKRLNKELLRLGWQEEKRFANIFRDKEA